MTSIVLDKEVGFKGLLKRNKAIKGMLKLWH